MKEKDLTIRILQEIRDEIKQTNARLEQTNERLDRTREELSKHIVESEMRTATAISELAGALVDVKTMLTERRSFDARVTRCEQEIEAIKQRIDA